MSKPQKILEYILGSLLAMLGTDYLLLGRLESVLAGTAWHWMPGLLRAVSPWLFLLLNLYPALPLSRPLPPERLQPGLQSAGHICRHHPDQCAPGRGGHGRPDTGCGTADPEQCPLLASPLPDTAGC